MSHITALPPDFKMQTPRSSSPALDVEQHHESQGIQGSPGLGIDDAFSTGEETEVGEIDLREIVGAVRSSNGRAVHDEQGEVSSAVLNPSITVSAQEMHRCSSRLTVVTSEMTEQHRFEDVSLSPPPSPLSTAGLSPNQIPVPFSPTSSPSGSSPTSLHNQQGPVLRSVSPKPTYLSPSSSIPTPPSVDPPSQPRISRSSSLTSRPPGPGIIRKAMSKTRPSYLPPKSLEEDLKHMKDWEAMMKRSREADDRKRQIQQERRASKESAVNDVIGIWEREVIPDWRVAVRNPELRKLWWKGIPTKLRGGLWFQVVGNGLALSKGTPHTFIRSLAYIDPKILADTFKTCKSRAQRAITSKIFPGDVIEEIEEDIKGTLPTLHIFHPVHGPMYQDLKDLLCAWTVARSDEGLGYVSFNYP